MIPNDSRSRPTRDTNASDPKSTGESESPWPKDGVAGQVQPAKRAAPADAKPLQILTVAYVAYTEDRTVESVWRQVGNHQLTDCGGENDAE